MKLSSQNKFVILSEMKDLLFCALHSLNLPPSKPYTALLTPL